jgi:hypothetical protein
MDPLVTGYKRRSGGLLEMFYKFSVVWADVFISQVTKIKVDLAEVAGVALRTRNSLLAKFLCPFRSMGPLLALP